MKTYKTNFSDAVKLVSSLHAKHEEGLIVSIADTIGYATGVQPNTYDKSKMCEEACYEGEYNGGCCVVFPGDLSICQVKETPSVFGKQLMTALEEYLEQKGLLVRVMGNDLMLYRGDVQGDKIASWAESECEDGLWDTVFHVSIGMDLSLIEQVCTKEGKHVGIGLGELGITAEEILEYFVKKGLIAE